MLKIHCKAHLCTLEGVLLHSHNLVSGFYFQPLSGSRHEDGTQSDSENALGEQRRSAAVERSWGLWGSAGGMRIREGRANVPEGLFAEEDSPARRRKSSKVEVGFVEPRHGSAAHQQSGPEDSHRHGDDCSDRGTYTIELENGDHEEEEARKMIDKVGLREIFTSSHFTLRTLSCTRFRSVVLKWWPVVLIGIYEKEFLPFIVCVLDC